MQFTTKLNEEMFGNSSLHQHWNACHDYIPQGMKNTEDFTRVRGTTELRGKQQFSAIIQDLQALIVENCHQHWKYLNMFEVEWTWAAPNISLLK